MSRPKSWLFAIRVRNGLRQEEVAEKVGISNTYYSAIENRSKVPSGSVGLKISQLLNFDMALFYVDKVYNSGNKKNNVH